MARYQWYDPERQIETTIVFPREGKCYISTRRAGRLVHAGWISRRAAENAVSKYGFQPLADGDTCNRSRYTPTPASDEEFLVAAHEALAKYGAALRRLAAR